ncbi:MAG: nuclear transport factor 2 family protein [Pyrinomonadaceae bacterium]
MKKMILILIIAIGLSLVVVGQTKTSKGDKVREQIIALEKSGWEAWKNKNAAWFQTNLTEEFISINSEGMTSKAQVVKSTATDCDVKSVSLDDFKFVLLDKNVALLTYTAKQDAFCGGKQIAPTVRSTVNYVNRGGRWLEALYMETPMTQ